MNNREVSFTEIEKAFIREKILPDFDWIRFKEPSPLNNLRTKLSDCRVALLGTGGAHLARQAKFDVRNKYGDDSYREIHSDAAATELVLSHPGYNTRKVSEDPNCVFPLDRLRELAAEGVIGELNHRAFSFMGYIPLPETLMKERAPAVARKMKEDQVDLVLLVPG